MSEKKERVSGMLRDMPAGALHPCYRAYFEQFNGGFYYEAHEVLEHLWLKDRQGPNGSFYKGLIQLAGAFVHLQRQRLRPAAALFKLAETNLRKYPSQHEQLALSSVLKLIEQWQARLAGPGGSNPLAVEPHPQLPLPS